MTVNDDLFYGHSSKKIARTKVEKKQVIADLEILHKENQGRLLTSAGDCGTIARALLDSSLISQTNLKTYQIKLIECGSYYHVYNYNYSKTKKDNMSRIKKEYPKKKYSKIKKYNNKTMVWGKHVTLLESGSIKLFKTGPSLCAIIRIMKLPKKARGDPFVDDLIIEMRNINRSRNSIQRLILANESKFKTFVTLTFADNVTNIEDANKKFNIWRTYIKKLKNDFAYIGVPEFQKRGAVHYHLLTNIDYNDYSLLSKDLIVTYSKKSHCYDYGRTIIGWKYGFSKVKDMDNMNVVGYLTKYLIKDLDNRLWGKKRYFNSQNLVKPKEILIDLSNVNDFMLYMDVLDYNKEYEDIYADKLGQVINFTEYKRKEV